MHRLGSIHGTHSWKKKDPLEERTKGEQGVQGKGRKVKKKAARNEIIFY